MRRKASREDGLRIGRIGGWISRVRDGKPCARVINADVESLGHFRRFAVLSCVVFLLFALCILPSSLST